MKILKINFRDFNAASLVNYRACQQHVGKPTLTAHQDNESVHASDFIASISFGREARFKWGTSKNDPHMNSLTLSDGDLVCFDRMVWHSVEIIGVTTKEWVRTNITLRAFNLPWYTNPHDPKHQVRHARSQNNSERVMISTSTEIRKIGKPTQQLPARQGEGKSLTGGKRHSKDQGRPSSSSTK